MVCPPSILYYKKHQKDIYAQGIIKDMKRMSESGRSFHEIPKYSIAGEDRDNSDARNN